MVNEIRDVLMASGSEVHGAVIRSANVHVQLLHHAQQRQVAADVTDGDFLWHIGVDLFLLQCGILDGFALGSLPLCACRGVRGRVAGGFLVLLLVLLGIFLDGDVAVDQHVARNERWGNRLLRHFRGRSAWREQTVVWRMVDVIVCC